MFKPIKKVEKLNLDYKPIVVKEGKDAPPDGFVVGNEGIGSSSAGSVCGVNPKNPPVKVALEKLGIISREEPDTELQYVFDFGHNLEPAILKLYEGKTGNKVEVDRSQFQHPLYPWMMADVDAFAVTPKGEKIGLEVKTFGPRMKYSWREGVYGEGGVPGSISYIYQVAHSMAVMNLDRFDIVANWCNDPNELIIITVHRDLQKELEIINKEGEFWANLQNRILPQDNTISSDAFDSILKNLNRETVEEENWEMANTYESVFDKILDLDLQKKTLEEEIKKIDEEQNALKLKAIQEIGDHTKGTCGKYQFTFKGSERETVDSKLLKTKFPDTYEEVKKITETKPTLRVKEVVIKQ